LNGSLELNIAGQVMVLLVRHGIRDARRLRIYERAVAAVIERESRMAGEQDWVIVQASLQGQLRLLGRAIETDVVDCALADMAAGDDDGDACLDPVADLPVRRAASG
jgi:hypothetical protein